METQIPGHRGDEACDAGRAAGWGVVGAADAVVLDGLNAQRRWARRRWDGDGDAGGDGILPAFSTETVSNQMRVFWAVVERPLPILASKLFEVSPAV